MPETLFIGVNQKKILYRRHVEDANTFWRILLCLNIKGAADHGYGSVATIQNTQVPWIHRPPTWYFGHSCRSTLLFYSTKMTMAWFAHQICTRHLFLHVSNSLLDACPKVCSSTCVWEKLPTKLLLDQTSSLHHGSRNIRFIFYFKELYKGISELSRIGRTETLVHLSPVGGCFKTVAKKRNNLKL